MAAASSASANNFWLTFRVFDDGLEAGKARAMTAANTAPRGHGPASFALFSQLPTELRLKVWEYMLAPRIVQVTCHDASSYHRSSYSSPPITMMPPAYGPSFEGYYRSYAELQTAQDQRALRPGGRGGLEAEGQRQARDGAGWQHQYQQPQPQQIPVLLHVNHETRTLALRHYDLAFAWKVPHVLAVNAAAGMQTYYYPQNHFPQQQQQQQQRQQQEQHPNHHPHEPAPTPPPPPPLTQPTPQPQPRTGAEARVYFSFARDMLYLCGELEPHDSFGFNSPMAYFVSRADAARVRRAAIALRSLGYGENGSQQIFGSLFHVVDRFGQGPRRPAVPASEPEGTAGEGAGGKAGTLVGAGAGAGAARGEGYAKAGNHAGRGRESQGAKKPKRKDEEYGLVGNRVLVAVTPADEHTHQLMGGEGPLVPPSTSPSPRSSSPRPSAPGPAGGKPGSGSGPGPEQGREDDVNVVQKIWRDWYRGSIVTSSLADTRFTLVREGDLALYL